MSENNDTLDRLATAEPFLWLNPELLPCDGQNSGLNLCLIDITQAEERLRRFAPLLEALFPVLAPTHGLIESPLVRAPGMQAVLDEDLTDRFQGELWIKADHDLPIAGSIKARGGIYEVLCFAETLALGKGLLLDTSDNYQKLANATARALFSDYSIAVGSTGNLGLSIGLMAAALGFKARVHMSVEAKQWKKERLRQQGVTVIEHSNDYSAAVAAGRAAAMDDPLAYFVDDENSETLFLGYSTAALRLQQQLQTQAINVDAQHPLFVYLPCGVGGAPGGITFGLKQLFGDAVHCFFMEPTQAPCMLLGMADGFSRNQTIYDKGLTLNTEADGLAVGQASSFVGGMMRALLSGVGTVADDQLFRDLYRLHQSEGMKIEPSAAAGFFGTQLLQNSEEGKNYLHGLSDQMANATHVVWTTGGGMVPENEYAEFLARGRVAANRIFNGTVLRV